MTYTIKSKIITFSAILILAIAPHSMAIAQGTTAAEAKPDGKPTFIESDHTSYGNGTTIIKNKGIIYKKDDIIPGKRIYILDNGKVVVINNEDEDTEKDILTLEERKSETPLERRKRQHEEVMEIRKERRKNLYN